MVLGISKNSIPGICGITKRKSDLLCSIFQAVICSNLRGNSLYRRALRISQCPIRVPALYPRHPHSFLMEQTKLAPWRRRGLLEANPV